MLGAIAAHLLDNLMKGQESQYLNNDTCYSATQLDTLKSRDKRYVIRLSNYEYHSTIL